jgi:hypothetical protein
MNEEQYEDIMDRLRIIEENISWIPYKVGFAIFILVCGGVIGIYINSLF